MQSLNGGTKRRYIALIIYSPALMQQHLDPFFISLPFTISKALLCDDDSHDYRMTIKCKIQNTYFKHFYI